MPRLNDFRDMIDNTDDKAVLESGQSLLREMMEIAALKERLSSLESNLTAGGKAIFYFFAEELDEDEIVFAAERITGKIRRLDKKAEKEQAKLDSQEEREGNEEE